MSIQLSMQLFTQERLEVEGGWMHEMFRLLIIFIGIHYKSYWNYQGHGVECVWKWAFRRCQVVFWLGFSTCMLGRERMVPSFQVVKKSFWILWALTLLCCGSRVEFGHWSNECVPMDTWKWPVKRGCWGTLTDHWPHWLPLESWILGQHTVPLKLCLLNWYICVFLGLPRGHKHLREA